MYIMFITNNHTSFDRWGMENLDKHQKILNSQTKLRNITKIAKQIHCNEAWGMLQAKNLFPDMIMDKIFEVNSCFHMNKGTTGEVQFLFF